MPIVYVLESVRKIMQEWFFDRLTNAKSSGEILCNRVESHLANLVMLSDKFVVQALTYQRYKIVDGIKSYVVDLAKRECDYWEFQLELIPCSHAIAAIRFVNYPVSGFVAECYRTDNLKGMWGGEVNPVPDPNEWVVPDNIKSEICNSPPCPRQAGCPRLTRWRSALESSGSNRKRQRCSHCKSECHNRVNCHAYIPLSDTTNAEATDVSQSFVASAIKRRPRKCSACGSEGHTKRKCPRVEII
ncbi:hypothetical protein ACS0TY_021870 [Phlomoides rotata]